MSATNHTTNLELSQYIGTDKPTYLVDYNQDMQKIDTGVGSVSAKAGVNETNIGTLANLTTTEKSSLVGATNEVNGKVGTLSSLTTTDKTDVVSAVNEVKGETAGIGNLSNLNTSNKSNLVSAINEVNTNVGNLNNLTTSATSSLVSAINEVDGNTDTNTTAIGTLSNLTTTEKSSLVGAINEVNANSIIDSGTGYIKYSDGTMICYGNVEGTTSQYNQWEAGLVFTNAINFSNFPVAFISTPVVSINMNEVQGGDIAWVMPGFQGNNTSTTNAGSFSLCRPSSFNNFHYDVDYVAIGKWK